MKKSIAIYGGSFNPIHVGHVFIANYAYLTGNFDEIHILPTFSHPNGKQLIDFNHRVNMCKLAFGYIPNVKINTVESELPVPSYTVDTIKFLLKTNPANYNFIMGSDLFDSNWSDLDELLKLAPAFVVGRHGNNSSKYKVTMPEISSTEIRKCLKSNSSDVYKYVPNSVLNYIQHNSLYT